MPSLAQSDVSGERLYQRLARLLFQELATGRYGIGDRLPAERELSLEHGVSRPAVREAMIALEVQGLIEVRVGSGAYVRKLPGHDEQPGFAITAFELTEARLLFEGEAAALAATHVNDDDLAALDALVDAINQENLRQDVTEEADRAFHLAVARFSRNTAIVRTIEDFWHLRATSPACALLHEKARGAEVRPVVAEHRAIVAALRTRDPVSSREAMRAHLSAVMEHLLFTTEERAVESARRSAARQRSRYMAALVR